MESGLELFSHWSPMTLIRVTTAFTMIAKTQDEALFLFSGCVSESSWSVALSLPSASTTITTGAESVLLLSLFFVVSPSCHFLSFDRKSVFTHCVHYSFIHITHGRLCYTFLSQSYYLCLWTFVWNHHEFIFLSPHPLLLRRFPVYYKTDAFLLSSVPLLKFHLWNGLWMSWRGLILIPHSASKAAAIQSRDWLHV